MSRRLGASGLGISGLGTSGLLGVPRGTSDQLEVLLDHAHALVVSLCEPERRAAVEGAQARLCARLQQPLEDLPKEMEGRWKGMEGVGRCWKGMGKHGRAWKVSEAVPCST